MEVSARTVGSDGAAARIPSVDPRHDGLFRTLTARGNEALRTGNRLEADRLYREALAEAERLLDLAAGEGQAVLIAPMALVVAAHNLATTETEAGREEEAHALSARAIERLVDIAGSPASLMTLRLNCLRHTRHALAFLAQGDHHSPSPAISRLRARVAEVGAEVIRVAELWRDAMPSGAPAARPTV